MATIPETTFSKHWHVWNILYFDSISLKFVPKDPIDNTSALLQLMPWRRPGGKPLSEPMLTQFTDAFMQHFFFFGGGGGGGGGNLIWFLRML